MPRLNIVFETCTSSTEYCMFLDLTCWEKGSCTGTLLESVLAKDELNCRDQCLSFSQCNWFTFDPIDGKCSFFGTCDNLNDGFCSNCVSGQVPCNSYLSIIRPLPKHIHQILL